MPSVKVRTLLGITLVVGAVTGCSASVSDPDSVATYVSAASPSATLNTYRSDAAGGFSVEYPGTWSEAQPTVGSVVALFVSPVSAIEDGYRPVVDIVVEPLRVALDVNEYAKRADALLARDQSSFHERERGTTTVNGLDAIWIEYDVTLDGQRLKQRHVMVVHGRDAVLIIYSAAEGAFDDQLSAARMAEESLQFDD
jgi:hypothetical protein